MLVYKRASIITVLLVLLFLLVMVISIGCVSHKKHVEKAREQITSAIGFIESNKDFLDLLLDIQKRIYTMNEEMISNPDISDANIMKDLMISISQGSFQMNMTMGSTSYAVHIIENGSEYDIISDSEKRVIANMLKEMMPDDHPFGLNVSSERITIDFYHYGLAYLYISSPAIEHEYPYGGNYINYEYARKVTDDWCVQIYKHE